MQTGPPMIHYTAGQNCRSARAGAAWRAMYFYNICTLNCTYHMMTSFSCRKLDATHLINALLIRFLTLLESRPVIT